MAKSKAVEPAKPAESISDLVKVTDVSQVPQYDSPEWPEYVLSQFSPEEVIDGHPKRDGIIRLIYKLVGPIVRSGVRSYQQGQMSKSGERILDTPSVVEWEMVIQPTKLGLQDEWVFSDIAEVYDGNCEAAFVRFALSTCATRAESRVGRKVLRLKASVEEITSVPLEVAYTEKMIDSNQITAISVMAKQMDVNVPAFIAGGKVSYKRIQDIPWNTALKMIDTLSRWKTAGKVPDEFRGHVPA